MIDRFQVAERHLDRIQAFHPRIDARIAAVAGWLLIEIGMVAANTKLEDLKLPVVWISLLIFMGCVVTSGIALWRALFPDQRGGASSLIYFARIAERTEVGYLRDFHAATDAELLDDFLGQIWRNSEIVCDKYRRVSRSIRWATFSLAALLFHVGAVSFIHSSLPAIKS